MMQEQNNDAVPEQANVRSMGMSNASKMKSVFFSREDVSLVIANFLDF